MMMYISVKLIIVFLIQMKVETQEFKLVWDITAPDDFEYERKRMSCQINNAPCSPNFIYIQKEVKNIWENASIVFDNRTYIPLNGHIGDRATASYGEGFKEFRLTIDPTLVKDTGNWRCMVQNCPSDDLFSDDINCLISTRLTKENITIDAPNFILLNSSSEYTCRSDRVYPEVNVTWTHGEKSSPGHPDNNLVGDYWQIKNTKSFTFCDRDNMNIDCTLEKTSGTNHWNESKRADQSLIYAPAIVEDSDKSHQELTTSDTLVIFCLASGTSRVIQWKKDGTILPYGLFNENSVTVTGPFTCGESEATNSTITWIQHDNSTCDDITAHDGRYQCVITAEKGAPDSSKEYEIEIHYAPILGTYFKELEARVGDTVILSCEVDCAMPNTLTYFWNSEHNRCGLGSNKSSVTITINKEDFNDTFVCIVNNSIGSTSLQITLTEKPLDIPTTTMSPDVTLTNPSDPSGLDFGAGIGIGIIIGVTMCVVLFGSLIFYHKHDKHNRRGKETKQHVYQNGISSSQNSTQHEQTDGLNYEEITKVNDPNYYNMDNTPTSSKKYQDGAYEEITGTRGLNVDVSPYQELQTQII